MVYKIGNLADFERLPSVDDATMALLYHHARTLSAEYGENRNVNESGGGYVLYVELGTDIKELKAFFDISKHTLEYVNTYGSLCEAYYILNNDFVVVIIISIDEASKGILSEIDK